MKKNIAVTILLIFCIGNAFTQTKNYIVPEKMNWWYNSRFGMFIHLGSYSYYGHGEWCMYNENWTKEDYQNKITKRFNPVNFNAEQIVSLAKQAGMKYIIITAKHHEGFCMWETNVNDFKDYTGTTNFDLYHFLGFQRDLLMELKNECDKQGLYFGLYYSILDWNHRSQYKQNYWSELYSLEVKDSFVEAEKEQIKELIERYHPSILWFDGDWCEVKDSATTFYWWQKQDAINLQSYILSIDSTIIINERIKRNLGLGDFICSEEKIPSKPLERQWETCQTMNSSWGFDSTKINNYRSPDTLIHEIEAIASLDGNYLLNIAPKGDGSLCEKDVSNLLSIGEWMNKYGESIYCTTRNPFSTKPSWGFYTKKEGKLYCHITAPNYWNNIGYICVPEMQNKIKKVYELSKPEKLLAFKTNEKEHQTYILLKSLAKPDKTSSVIVIEVEGTPTEK
ncbi:MAG: alpha-L-fucosidase [Bacteroidales bacterium]|nr:alpha-L-fucosidase [Bacteroidales bacterium]